jgi:hypothetical protein
MLKQKAEGAVPAAPKQVLTEKRSKIGSQVIFERKIKKYLLEI